MDHRTQIHLSETDYRRAVRYARGRSLSLAGVVREALSEYLAAREGEAMRVSAADVIDGLVGIGASAEVLTREPRDVALRHDDYLIAALSPAIGPPRPRARRAGKRDCAR